MKGIDIKLIRYYIFFLLSLILTSSLYGLTPAEIQQARAVLEANPSLINSTSNNNINHNFPIENEKQLIIKNDIEPNLYEQQNIIEEPYLEEPYIQKYYKEYNNDISRLSPLSYKENLEKLSEIKSDQSNTIHKRLQRFSKEFFRNKNTINPNRIAAPSNYIINKGDIITFWIYGATNMQHQLEVDARGNINIPQVGPVHVAGEKFQEVKDLLTNYLASSYKNSQVVVDLNSFSTAQITVTGFVNAPGIYNTTSVSSVKDILMQAQGVSDVGSVRKIKVIRNGQIIDTIDYYHLLAQGLDHGDTVLQSGDTIHVPRAYGLISIDGEVHKAAIYEIEPRETLAKILQLAGGLKAAANGKKIYIKRFNRHSNIEYKTLTLSQARQFITKDGDEVYIGKLNKVDERYIEVIGNVIDEGKKHIDSGKMKLSSFLHSQIKGKKLNSFFLENTQFDYAMVKRIEQDLTPKIYNVNLLNILKGKEDFTLQNRDKLYIFNKLDTSINPYVTIIEATPPLYQMPDQFDNQTPYNYNNSQNPQTRLNNQTPYNYNNSQNPQTRLNNQNPQTRLNNQTPYNYNNSQNPQARLNNQTPYNYNYPNNKYYDNFENNNTQIYNNLNPLQQYIDNNKSAYPQQRILMKEGRFQFTEGMTLQDLINSAGVQAPFDRKRVKIFSLGKNNKKPTVKVIDYDKMPHYKLKPFDVVTLFNYFETNPLRTATVTGEVIKPGRYPISESMTLEEFIESAGGLSEKAYPKECEIVRYYTKNDERKKKILNVSLSEMKSFIIQPYDEINIKRIPYWDEKKYVTLEGEIKFPGKYVIHSGEKLSSVIKRAGGFTKESFLYGAIFTRKEIATLQKKSLQRSLSKLKEQVILASLRSSNSKSSGQISIKEGIEAVESLITEAKKLTPIGRVSISLISDLERFKNSPSDLTLKDGDTLTIPSHNDTVVVSGEVMNPMALAYMGDDVKDYISRCGGITEIADSDHIYVLHANGEAQKASLGSYLFSSNTVEVRSGDVIIIPKKIMFERGIDIAGDIADIIYKLTLTVAAMNTVGVF